MEFQFKRNIFFVNGEDGAALFYWFGNRFYIRGPFVKKGLGEAVYDELSRPCTKENLVKKLSAQFGASNVEAFFEALVKNSYLQKLEGPRADYDRRNPLHQFFSRFAASDSEIGRYVEKISGSKISVFNAGHFAPDFLRAISFFGPGQIILADDGLINDADVANNHTFFTSADAGKSRGEIIAAKMQIENLVYVPSADFTPAGAGLTVGLGHWYALETLRALNLRMNAAKSPWLLVLQDYYGGMAGPYLGESGGPCLNCLLLRRKVNLFSNDQQDLVESYFAGRAADTAHFAFAPFTHILAQMAAVEVIKLITGIIPSKTRTGALEFDALNNRNSFQPVMAFPYCQVCGDAHQSSPRRLEG